MTRPSDRPDPSNPIHFLATGFAAGLMPFAPGTFGTLVAVPIWFALQDLALLPYLGVVVIVTMFGIWLCERTARDLGIHDHPAIVWDEIAGYLVTMTAAPAGWQWAVVGFLLFRVFDIFKPWPIGLLDRRVGGGVGIMLDDLVAGVYAGLGLQLLVSLEIF